MTDLELITTLLNTGIGALALWLYFTERTAHGQTRTEYIKELNRLHEARIADYQMWLELSNNIITVGINRPLFQPAKEPTSVKTQQIDKR